ncbi:MAG TPA: hypothetical protein VGH21_05020, partial [Solirubrobacteraceae bacterium]
MRRPLALAGLLVLLPLAGCSGAGADPKAQSSKFHEPAISPSCVPPQLNVTAALAGGRVTVSPAPQSRDASVSTQLSILGVPAS